MKVDRYTKVVLTVIAVALSTLAFKDIVAPQPAVAAAPALGEGRYQLAMNVAGGVVIDTRSGTVYRVQGKGTVATLDTRTGYGQ